MKLNNHQIEAICNQAQKQHNEKQNPKPVLITASMKKEAADISKAISKFSTPVFKHIFGYGNEKMKTSEYWEKWLTEKAQPTTTSFDRQGFKDKIHLASIDSNDLKELSAKLKIKIS